MPPGGLHIRWPDARAGAGSAPVRLQVVRRAGLHPRQPAEPQRDRGPERPLRPHRQRQGLQRHAPGAARPGAGRRHLPRSWASGCTRWAWSGRWRRSSRANSPPACRRSWWSRKSARSSNTSSRKSSTTGAPTCGPTCWASSTTAEGDAPAANGRMPNPSGQHAAARQGRPDAGADRPGHCPAAEEARRARRHRGAHGRAPGRDARPRSARCRCWTVQRRPPALVLLGLPAQHLAPRCPKARARWPASAATSWRSGWTAPPSASRRWAARACPGSGQQPFTHRPAHVRQPGRRHLLPQRHAGDPPEHRGGREHHLQDPLQRRGGHDRRPAGRRAARGAFGDPDRAEHARRGRGEDHHRHRRAREIRRRARACPKASPSSTATRWTRCSASSARSRAPPSSSTTRPAPPKSAAAASAARWSTRPSAWSSTSWCAKAAATAACRATA